MAVPVEAWLGWSIYGAVALVVVGFSAWFVAYYKLRDEPYGVTGVVGFFSILFALLSLFLIPIDVYMCPDYGDNGHNYRSKAKFVYYCFYSIFLFCIFIAIPFGYFYYEELGDLQDRNNTFAQKAGNALKYTGFTAILWVTLIVIGLFVNFNSHTPNDGNDEWTHKIADSFSNNIDGIMPFCIAVVTGIGMFFSMVYTAFGLAAFPISLMRPVVGPNKADDPRSLSIELRRVSTDLDMLYTKYRGHDSWPPQEKAKKMQLERKKKILTIQKQRTDSSVSNNDYPRETCCARMGRCFWNSAAPIRYVIGIALEGLSILMVVSIMMHLIDQIANSSCGYQCGFALNEPKLSKYDPVSWLLTTCAPYFPLDYIFFSAIIFWLFWCTIFGIMRIDVRVLCFKLFSLRPHETMHNALLMAIGFLLLILTSFNYLAYSLASQYMTFGDQGTHCAIVCGEGSDDGCVVCEGTEIYYLLSGILIGMPVFGLVYFALSSVFVLVFFGSLVYNLYRKPKKSGRLLRNDSDDDLEAVFRD